MGVIYNISTLSETIVLICKSFRNRCKSELWQSFLACFTASASKFNFSDNTCILYLSCWAEKVQNNWQTVQKRAKTRVCLFSRMFFVTSVLNVTISYHLKRNYYILIVVDHVKFKSHRTLNQSTLRHSLNLYVTMLPHAKYNCISLSDS